MTISNFGKLRHNYNIIALRYKITNKYLIKIDDEKLSFSEVERQTSVAQI